MKISAFPKCYLENIARHRTMTIFEWIKIAKDLDVDGLEMYDGFFERLDADYVDLVGESITEAGFEMPMMCCSPDFTHPNPDVRKQAIKMEVDMIRLTRRLGGPRATCRVLTGQRYPNVNFEQGLEWVVESINSLIPVAKEYDIVLALENHYKDGHWKYPEFAQKKEVFLQVLNAIPEKHYI